MRGISTSETTRSKRSGAQACKGVHAIDRRFDRDSPPTSRIPFSSSREVIESSATMIDFVAGLRCADGAASTRQCAAAGFADFSRSATFSTGATCPEPSTVAPAILRTLDSGFAQLFHQHLALHRARVHGKGDAVLADAKISGRRVPLSRSRCAAASRQLQNLAPGAQRQVARPPCAERCRDPRRFARRRRGIGRRARPRRSARRTSARTADQDAPKSRQSRAAAGSGSSSLHPAGSPRVTRPPSFSVFSRTIARPRPRPDSRGDIGLVENPVRRRAPALPPRRSSGVARGQQATVSRPLP